ncbi:hypothetical protein [Dactylosporangium matsuzakiense]|nr:hypothetical protein [Dactylosporangium matsuzakiense]UWZ47870.1 hypothetical protein Dmats_16575 [Dactylosporangium matsuzakiense]
MRRMWIVAMSTVVALVAGSSPAVAAPGPRGIADRLMLQADDLAGQVPGPVEDGLAWPLRPQPCADTPVPQPVAARALAADYGGRFRVYEQVSRYRGDGAERYVAELSAQLARCGVGGGDNGLDPQVEGLYGPDSLLFFGNYDEGDRYVAYGVKAVGCYVVLVMMSDSLYGAPDVTTLNGIVSAAIGRVSA